MSRFCIVVEMILFDDPFLYVFYSMKKRAKDNVKVFLWFFKQLKWAEVFPKGKKFQAKVFYRINKRMEEDIITVVLFKSVRKVVFVPGNEIKGDYESPLSFDAWDELLTFGVMKEGGMKIKGSSAKVFSFEIFIYPT